jgi:hypothetical protein
MPRRCITFIAWIQGESPMSGQRKLSGGTWNVTVAGEQKNFTKATVTISSDPARPQKQVSFSTPNESSAYETLTVRYNYNAGPAPEPVIPGEYATPGASYGVAKPGGWVTVYHAGSGTVTLVSSDEATQAMKGSFTFQVSVDGVIKTVEGTFDLHE